MRAQLATNRQLPATGQPGRLLEPVDLPWPRGDTPSASKGKHHPFTATTDSLNHPPDIRKGRAGGKKRKPKEHEAR